jgi:predicted PhzF superfamily epimerase YddE/YHI9
MEATPSNTIVEALGKMPVEYFEGNDHVAVYENENDILNLKPDFKLMAQDNKARGILVTAPADKNSGIDFISRCFFPKLAVDEDPVTGSAHCILAPIWAEKLGKTKLKAKQVSKRSGELLCEIKGNRIHITGNAVLYMKGQIHAAS